MRELTKIFATHCVSDCYLKVSCFAYLRAAPCLSANNRFLYNILSAIFMDDIFSWMCHIGCAACGILNCELFVGFVDIIHILVACLNLSRLASKSRSPAIIMGAKAKPWRLMCQQADFLISSLCHASATVIVCARPKWPASRDGYWQVFYVAMESFAG